MADSALRLQRTHFDDRGEFDQFGLVVVGVVLAEQQLGSRGARRAHPGCRPTTVAAVSLGQFWTGERSGHGTSIGCSDVLLLCQTPGVPALFPGGSRVCRVSRLPALRAEGAVGVPTEGELVH